MDIDDDDEPLVVAVISALAATNRITAPQLSGTDECDDDEPLVVPATQDDVTDSQTRSIRSCTLNPSRAFITPSAVRKCYEECGGDANPLVFSKAHGQYASKVYFIWDGVQIYAGFTENLHNRIREHDRYVDGGASFTSWKRKESTNWSIVCVVTKFPTRRSARQFESRCHVRSCEGLVYDKMLYANTLHAMSGALVQRDYIRFMLKVLNMERWTPHAEPASSMPLTLNWFNTDFRPIQLANDSPDSYLPPYITQRVVTAAEKEYILAFRPGEKRVQTDYKSAQYKASRRAYVHAKATAGNK